MRMRSVTAAGFAVAALVLAVPMLPSAGAGDLAERRTVEVVRWVDGDTVETTAGTVRLIGVDTPERGRCGYAKASDLARRLAPVGSRVRLTNPASVVDTDAYGRLLRYVNRGSVDVSLRQIKAGSVARYDSIDGYDRHPRQRAYRSADRAHRNYNCGGGRGDGNSSGSGGPYAPNPGTWDCPRNAPIKGNQGDDEWIYHMPGQAYYDATNPEECFATAAAAERAGYRAAKV